MSNSWSKEDRLHYAISEVMQELEKRVLDTINRVDILREKTAATAQQRVEQLNSVTEAANNAAEAMSGVLGDSAQDHIADDESAEDGLIEDGEDFLLQEEVVDDLKRLANAAIEEGNIKLAYKIERTIDEILEQEVTCG